jgi:hypothetical protein
MDLAADVGGAIVRGARRVWENQQESVFHGLGLLRRIVL